MSKPFIRQTYWTEARLADLDIKRQTMKMGKLKKHFRRTPEDIFRAINFLIMSEKLEPTVIFENGIKITVYKAWYAQNVVTSARQEKPVKMENIVKKSRKSASQSLVDKMP